jgi:hypothetical protein
MYTEDQGYQQTQQQQQQTPQPHQQQHQQQPHGMPPPHPGHHRMASGDSNYSNMGSYSQQGPRQFAPILNGGSMHGQIPPHLQDVITPTEYQMFDFPPDQPIPIWMSEDNLGDAGYGLEAFVVPQQFESQIW